MTCNDAYFDFVNQPGAITGIDRSKIKCDFCNQPYADLCNAMAEGGSVASVMKICDLCSSFNVAWTCMEYQNDECKMEFSDDESCDDYHDAQRTENDPKEFEVKYNLSYDSFHYRRGILMIMGFWTLFNRMITGAAGMSPDQEFLLHMKQNEYTFMSQTIHTLAWFLLAGAIVWRISQILECFRDFLVNFNMTCVKFAAWAPNEYNNWKEAWKSEYHGTKGWMLREYLEMKAHLVAVKEMYQKMAMISLIIQSSMSVIAMLFIPLMWCFGRNETKRYEYRAEGIMKNGFKLGQMFKGFCALMALGFLFFGNKKKAASCKEYWSYMFCNEDAWGFLRSIKRWFQGKDSNIKIPKSFQTDEVREAVDVTERGFGNHSEIPNDYDEMERKDAERRKKEGKEPLKPLPKTKCPECGREAALTGVMGHPKYIRLCIGCKKRWLDSDIQKAQREAKKLSEFEATKKAMGEALWSEMLDDEVTDLTHELHLDVVAEANKEHAAAGTELRDTANDIVEEIQAVDLIQRQMEKNKVEVVEPLVEEVEKIDALAMSQLIIHLDILQKNDQSVVGKAGRWYVKLKKYFMNRVHWTHPNLTPRQFADYLCKVRSYITNKPTDEIDEQQRMLEEEAKACAMNKKTLIHIKEVAKKFMEERGDAVEKAKTFSMMRRVISRKAGKPKDQMEVFDDLQHDVVAFAEAMDKADPAYPEKNPSKPEEKEEEVVDQTTKAEGVIKSIVQTVIGAMVECVTLANTIEWLTMLEIRMKYDYLDDMVLTEKEVEYWKREIQFEITKIVKRWVAVRNIGHFMFGMIGTFLIAGALRKPENTEEVLEGDHRKGANTNKRRNMRHSKKVRGTKYWDIFKGASSGNIEAEDMVQIMTADGNDVIDEMPFDEFKNSLDEFDGREYEFDGAGRIPFMVKSSGYRGYAIRREGFVREGIQAQKLKKMREEIVQTKFAKKREDRNIRREKAIANLKNLKRHLKSKGACKVCMLMHKGPCKFQKFGATESLLNNLAVVHESYVSEGILNGDNFIGSEDYCGRVGKCYIDGEFKMNCYLQSDKVILWKHALGETEEEQEMFKDAKYAQNMVLFKFPSVTLKPKTGFIQYDQIEDFIVFPVQTAQKLPAIPLRKPKVCETFMLMSYTKDSSKPVFTQGVAGINGHHSGSTTYGFCVAPLMSLKDKNILGWHCAGGDRSNRFVPVTDDLIEFLKKPVN